MQTHAGPCFPASDPLLRRSIGISSVVLLAVAAGAFGQPTADEAIVQRARGIHGRAITLDTHVDIAGPEYATEKLDPGMDNPKLKCDLVKMARGGVDGVFLAVFVGQARRDAEGYQHAYQAALDKFAAIQRLAEKYPDRCALAFSTDDARRIVRSGKQAVMIGVENGYAIGADLGRLDEFHRLGARYVTLCHNGHNQICDSCNPNARLGDKESEHGGLSQFGREVVARMNRLGMMIDVSHLAPQSFWDVVAVSKAPIIASHSGCRALNDHPRNLDDEQLKALANSGGVIQIVAVGSFLKAPSPERRLAMEEIARKLGIPIDGRGPRFSDATEEQLAKIRELAEQIDQRFPPARLKDYVDHLDHAVQVAGVDHVGIGSDFDGGGGVVGFNDHADALNVTVELVRRGYSEEDIRKIWGENLLRVWRRAEGS